VGARRKIPVAAVGILADQPCEEQVLFAEPLALGPSVQL
jgi:hypothetical protein